MTGQIIADRQPGRLDRVKARREILVPILGLLVFHAVIGWEDVPLTPALAVLVYGSALAYAALVIWSPMALPSKEPRPVTRPEAKAIAGKLALVVLTGFGVLTVLSLTSEDPAGSGRLGPVGALVAVVLMVGLGTAGLIAERTLRLDLFPVLRRRELRRVFYVLIAAFFLALIDQLWKGIFSDLASGIGRAFGETPPVEAEAASHFDVSSPLRLFLNFLIGAGLFEELLFRVGVMTPIWALTRKWGWGWLASSLIFGLYHITPLSGMAAANLQAPVTAVLESIGAGLSIGLIYRYRGFAAAVMTHALGNWFVVMILMR